MDDDERIEMEHVVLKKDAPVELLLQRRLLRQVGGAAVNASMVLGFFGVVACLFHLGLGGGLVCLALALLAAGFTLR